MNWLRTIWRRRVTGRPDQYQAYVSFPGGTDGPSVGAVHDRIEDLEYLFEGRLDVVPQLRGIAVTTDRVPAADFDADAFDAILDRIEEAYADTHRLARLEKWRSIDGRVVRSSVVVPVRPLFRTGGTKAETEASPAE
ncbi:hypothetical protein SAMN05444422_10788 [Halobiforma haloterrestris]|uniref:Uncharacterized protein n=1 Tax=Natronobacterium haloterrestre TaxID=148448 RepID=A0A1I1ICX1_NATHA|nr:hypothetical protein [Halobiforma haloterrestris]SFC33965.1 hypothetical protein SAMN05444422_10788 [Halobiforma haloterrestris]